MKEKPDINPMSHRLLTQGNNDDDGDQKKPKQTYVNLKVEDRLRLYGIKLKETKSTRAALAHYQESDLGN